MRITTDSGRGLPAYLARPRGYTLRAMTEIAQPVGAGLTTRAPSMRVWAMPLALALATVAAVLPTLLSASDDRGAIAVPIFLAGAAVSLGIGLYDLARGRDVRYAGVLIGGGLLWCLSALAASSVSILYSVGRVSQWLVELAVIYLLLSYPSGRLGGRLQRVVFGASASVVAVLYLPTALIAHQFPHPSPWSACTADCPSNAFAIVNVGAVQDVVVPLRAVLTVVLFVAIAAIAIQRARTSGALLGRMYAPIALIAVVQAATLTVYLRARAAGASPGALDVLSWIYVLSLPTVGLAASAGRLYRRLFTVKALEQMAQELRTSATPAHVGRVMAQALEDPSLAVLHSFPGDAGVWVDESGAAVRVPGAESGRAVTEIANGSWRIALVHDPTLAEDPVLLQTAGSYALAALENDKLTAELRTSLQELMEARVLGITAERRGRRKIERDIHDGAQQRLVALRIKLALTADKIGSQDAAGAEALRALGKDIDATIEEVRSFARGIYPPLLAETGLGGSVDHPGARDGSAQQRDRRRTRALLPRDRDDGLLLDLRSAPERSQARPRSVVGHGPPLARRCAALRGRAMTASALTRRPRRTAPASEACSTGSLRWGGRSGFSRCPVRARRSAARSPPQESGGRVLPPLCDTTINAPGRTSRIWFRSAS